MSIRQSSHLSFEKKNKLVQFLLKACKNGKPVRGKIREAADLFGVNRKTVTSLWAIANQQLQEGKPISITSNRVGGIYKKLQLDEEKMKNFDAKDRSTIRDLAKEMDVSKTIIRRWIKEGRIRPHTNAINPFLTKSNKIHRLEYSLSQLHVDREDSKIKFSDMCHVIHIDEKWFYITTVSKRYYKLPSEVDSYRTCKNKRYITKVMFLCAVGRPHYANDGTLLFDGNIGIFPFTEQVPAKRNSKNRARGTLETKNVESITKEIIKSCIINQVIPNLKSKWPTNASKSIFIQQDNAKPHISNNDADFRAATSSDGFNIQLFCQPPNSPDTNINDLGFFKSIQSLQQKKKAKNVDGLVHNVNQAFEELTHTTLNKVFLSLQCCCIEIMNVKGGNNYDLQHMNKDGHLREGLLPKNLEVDEVLIRECIDFLRQPENGSFVGKYDLVNLMTDLGY